MHQMDRLVEAVERLQNPSMLGLDTRIEYVPGAENCETAEEACERIRSFQKALIDALHDVVPAVKLQIAYYERFGIPGMRLFQQSIRDAVEAGLVVVADAKRGDIGATAQAYAEAFLTDGAPFASDMLTVNPYFGTDGLQPFIDACQTTGRGAFILVKTSNPSGAELQDLVCDGKPIYEHVAARVVEWGRQSIGQHGYSAIGAVVGATCPEQAARLRKLLPQTYFLVPGYGAQGGTSADLAACFDAKGSGAIVNASRSILCAHQKRPGVHFADAAREEALRMKADLLSVLGGRIGQGSCHV